jgi:hypothetical protein
MDCLFPDASKDRYRLSQSIGTALKHGSGPLLLDETSEVHYFSQNLTDPESNQSRRAIAEFVSRSILRYGALVRIATA